MENSKLLVSIKFLHIYSHFCLFGMPHILNIENVAIFRKKNHGELRHNKTAEDIKSSAENSYLVAAVA